MHKPDKYVFPAVFSFYSNGSIGIMFPDLPGCVSSAKTLDEALYMASDALALHISGIEEDGDAIPQPSDCLTLKSSLAQEQIIVPVMAFMPTVRERIRNRNVNKMCTVPSWLVHEAERQGLNFSHTLQDALMLKLGVKRSPKRRR